MAELGTLSSLLQEGEGEEKAVEITVDMLDFDYVKTCEDTKKLKGILEKLQSHTEGFYPEVSASVCLSVGLLFFCVLSQCVIIR
jgi:hypothetical protein